MVKLSINLPPRYRLDLALVKSRKGFNVPQPLIPSVSKLQRMRSGNKISRIFRQLFEHGKIRKIIASQLPIIILATGLVQNPKPTEGIEISPSMILEQSDVKISTEKGIQYPTQNVKISQGYHLFHPGIDLDGTTGDPVRPIMAGFVEAIQFSKYAYGNAVIINHGNGITSLYAHLSKIEVKKEQKVSFDTKIGEVGATGRALGDHLHLEIADHGRTFNPLSVLPKR